MHTGCAEDRVVRHDDIGRVSVIIRMTIARVEGRLVFNLEDDSLMVLLELEE